MATLDETKRFKTLQELAASKTVQELLKSDNPAEEFQSFNDHEQKLVFTQLIGDFTRVMKQNDQYKESKERTPYIDWQLNTQRHERIRSADDVSDVSAASTDSAREAKYIARRAEKETEEFKSMNGYCLKDIFLEAWDYYSEAENVARQPENYNDDLRKNHFDIMTLCSHGAEGDLVVCHMHERFKGPSSCGHPYESHCHLYDKISSQLLYYRVTAIFGMPPSDEMDGYKSAWWAHLTHKDGQSQLEVGDWKGHATANFSGTPEGRESALALLNFLTGLNCPHTYDGVIAGIAA